LLPDQRLLTNVSLAAARNFRERAPDPDEFPTMNRMGPSRQRSLFFGGTTLTQRIKCDQQEIGITTQRMRARFV
jgi:hypothetical protein